MVFTHLGGNVITIGSLTLDRNIMKRQIVYLRATLPDSIIIWIDISQRLDLQNSNHSFQGSEHIWKRINRYGRQYVSRYMFDLLTMDSGTEGFYGRYGIHLTKVLTMDSSTEGFYGRYGIHWTKVCLEFYL